MKPAKVFLISIYARLFCCVNIFVSAMATVDQLITPFRTFWSTSALLLYRISVVVSFGIGLVCIATAVLAYSRENAIVLRSAVRTLYIDTAPVYLLHYLAGLLVFLLGGMQSDPKTAGLLLILLALPTLQSGVVGACFVMHLRRHRGRGDISAAHYLLMILPVSNLLDSRYLLLEK